MCSTFTCFLFTLSLFLCFSFLQTNSTESLEASVQESAFRTLVPHTGALYTALLPASLSGVKVSIARVRSGSLWKRGANFSQFHIPPRTLPRPHVKRLALVYQDMGNWSSRYYALSGYSLIASVVSFTVFDATNPKSRTVTKIGLTTQGRPVSIRFPNSTFRFGAKCVEFKANGTVVLSEMGMPDLCYSRDQGHFSVAVPLEGNEKKRRRRRSLLWVVGVVVGGVLVVVLVAYFGMVFVRALRTKKIEVMERQADEDLVLQSVRVGGTKMPSASMTRTQPVLEIGGF